LGATICISYMGMKSVAGEGFVIFETDTIKLEDDDDWLVLNIWLIVNILPT